MQKHSNKHTRHGRFGSALLLAGLVTSVLGVTDAVPSQGQLLFSGQGALVLNAPVQEMLLQQTVVMPAAPDVSEINVGLVAFGALMMLLGFGLHALIVLRTRDEQPVPVKIRKNKLYPRTSRKQMEVIWVERTIRL